MNIFELKQACLKRVEDSFLAAEEYYAVTIPRVPVTFSAKSFRTAGTASYKRSWADGKLEGTGIKLSLQLLQLNDEAFIKDTPGHEAAHIIDYFINNQASHGPTWKRIMRIIGQDPKRTHNFKTPATNRVPASCGCADGHSITKQMANKIRRGATYTCKKCKVSLIVGSTAPQEVRVYPDKVAAQRKVVDELFGELHVTAPGENPKPNAKRKVATKRKVAGSKSKAEMVRDIIRANPTHNAAMLIDIVLSQNIIPKGNVKKYVTENIVRVRG